MTEIARYQEVPVEVVVSRDGVLAVLHGLGAGRPAWTEPLAPTDSIFFQRAHRGDTRVIELSARGEKFTTILHEIVRRGRTVALNHALAHGVDPGLVDSEGATPMHVINDSADNVNPEIVRALVRSGASVNTPLPSGTQPIELAARMILPATVAAMVELGADPGRGLHSLMAWWSVGAKFNGYRAVAVAEVVDLLRAGGAAVSQRHRELAANAGASEVEAALRR